MKKIKSFTIGLAVLSLFLFSNSAFAFTMSSATYDADETIYVATCVEGNQYGVFAPLDYPVDPGVKLSGGSCSEFPDLNLGSISSKIDPVYNGNLIILECAPSGSCLFGSLTDERLAATFISEQAITITGGIDYPSTGGTTMPTATDTLSTIGTAVINTSVETSSWAILKFWPFFLILGILFALIFWGKRVIKT